MSQQQHTPGPWYASKEDGNWRVMAADENGGYTLADMYCDDPEANARRIVACVNACAGIQTEQLESVIGKLAISSSISMWQSYCDKKMQLEDAIEQRDTLLAALEELNSVSARGFLYDDPARVKARAAIASVKGGECKHCGGSGISQISDPCICQYGTKGGAA